MRLAPRFREAREWHGLWVTGNWAALQDPKSVPYDGCDALSGPGGPCWSGPRQGSRAEIRHAPGHDKRNRWPRRRYAGQDLRCHHVSYSSPAKQSRGEDSLLLWPGSLSRRRTRSREGLHRRARPRPEVYQCGPRHCDGPSPG